jgi:Bacteriophage probable baseplate hub protein
MPDSTVTGFYISTPTLKVDGTEKTDLAVELHSLFVEETTLGLFRCEATFINWGTKDSQPGYLFFDRQTLDFGKEFAVEFGPPGSQSQVFKGRITGIEAHFPSAADPLLTVLAEDRFQDLRMERRTRSFADVSDSDVFSQIASQHGLSPQVDVDGPTYRVLTQVNQSDLAFLRERAAAIDAEVWVDDRTLHAQSRTRRNTSTVELKYGRTLLEFSALADLSHQRTSVRVSGWDVAGKSALDEEAGESVVSAELDGKRSGASVLGQALAERNERVTSSVPLSQPEAKALAEARYRARARRFVTGRGAADGTPSLRIGSTLDLTGLGDLFDGKYYVRLARHTFDLENGYRTSFEVERPGLGG